MLRSYTVADLFTLGNASSGTIAIFLCLNYIAEGRNRFFWIAFLLHFVALGCDVTDGYWARRFVSPETETEVAVHLLGPIGKTDWLDWRKWRGPLA